MSAPVIYYIRHGETAWNAAGRLQGAQDTALNDLGRRQSIGAGAILGDLFAREGRDAASLEFVASPLGRARMTMELVRGALKLPLDDYAIDERLREIGYGQWEGSTLAEAQAADPELFAARVAAQVVKAYVEKQRRQPTKMAKDAGKVDVGAIWSAPDDDGDKNNGFQAGHFFLDVPKKPLPLAAAAPGLQ